MLPRLRTGKTQRYRRAENWAGAEQDAGWHIKQAGPDSEPRQGNRSTGLETNGTVLLCKESGNMGDHGSIAA